MAPSIPRVACLVAWALVFATPAWGHEAEQHQRLLLQVHGEHVEGLLLYELGAGQEAALLRVSFDVDRSGALEEGERRALAEKLARDALTGLSLEREGESLRSVDLDWRLELGAGSEGSILLAMMLRFEGGGAGRYEASLSGAQRGRRPIRFEAEAGPGYEVRDALSAPERDGIATGALVLTPGDALWFEIGSAAPSAPSEGEGEGEEAGEEGD